MISVGRDRLCKGERHYRKPLRMEANEMDLYQNYPDWEVALAVPAGDSDEGTYLWSQAITQ